MSASSLIFGCEGLELTDRECAFFRDANPWGFILFERNVETPDQMRRLTAALRETVGRDCLIFIDQEGGRVQRLRPPHWPDYPAPGRVAATYDDDPALTRQQVYLHHRLIAADLYDLGITANCAPMLDMPVDGSDPVISDRALGRHPEQVSDLARAAMSGLISGGVAPVIKHIPGHGRATVDSHKALPVVSEGLDRLSATDFAPFAALNEAPMAMTAHIVFREVDAAAPVTLSPTALKQIVRDRIGFEGLLMTDDLDMKALSGSLAGKTRKSLEAGCDLVLHCSGHFPSMVEIANEAGTLSGDSAGRADAAQLCAPGPSDFDRVSAWRQFTHAAGLPAEA
ncbi:MAG: beta-N-acetylhexosaminidase [Hyphomonadaceae bacterium]|nr:beta-N-acetylhexosaminidase [Hyphomonadaceae bacterium]